MAMLAEPRRKQKWTLNPRGKQWSDDSNKFGQKMLEKMGWTSGKGLGAKEQGMTEHVRVKFKDDAGGIGYSKDDQDKYWTEHQENFNELLQNLQATEEDNSEKMSTDLSGKSLELKSKQSRARVHYQKFTRGKDVNKYSAKDLANIFGKKDLSNSPSPSGAEEIAHEEIPDAIGTTDTTAGVLTIKGGSMNDYFKSKFPNFQITPKKQVREDDKSSESECERHVGFGFSSPSILSIFSTEKAKMEHEKSDNSSKTTPSKGKSEFYIKTPNSTHENSNFEEHNFQSSEIKCEEDILKKKKKKKKDKRESAEDNSIYENSLNNEEDGSMPNSSEITDKKMKKRKKKDRSRGNISEVTANSGIQENPAEIPLSNESRFIFDNPALNLNSPESKCDDIKKLKKKKKKVRDPVECIPQDEELPELLEASSKYENKRNNLVLEPSGLDLNSTSEIDVRQFIFENPALDLNSPEIQEVPQIANKYSKKNKRKKPESIEGFSNPALDLECRNDFIASDNFFEISRETGLSNEALDITDESSSKKRVTFNDEIEYNTDSAKKKKSKRKLDKFEVDNDKLRKKKIKKESTEVQSTVGFVNPALEVEVINDEIVDNEENERKSKKCERRRKRRISNLETIEEIPEEEKFENSHESVLKNQADNVIDETPTKRRRRETNNENLNKENCDENHEDDGALKKKKKKDKKLKIDEEENDESLGITMANEIVDEFQCPEMIRTPKSKKILKNLFSKSPILNFTGSNINEIRGYGVNV